MHKKRRRRRSLPFNHRAAIGLVLGSGFLTQGVPLTAEQEAGANVLVICAFDVRAKLYEGG